MGRTADDLVRLGRFARDYSGDESDRRNGLRQIRRSFCAGESASWACLLLFGRSGPINDALQYLLQRPSKINVYSIWGMSLIEGAYP